MLDGELLWLKNFWHENVASEKWKWSNYTLFLKCLIFSLNLAFSNRNSHFPCKFNPVFFWELCKKLFKNCVNVKLGRQKMGIWEVKQITQLQIQLDTRVFWKYALGVFSEKRFLTFVFQTQRGLQGCSLFTKMIKIAESNFRNSPPYFINLPWLVMEEEVLSVGLFSSLISIYVRGEIPVFLLGYVQVFSWLRSSLLIVQFKLFVVNVQVFRFLWECWLRYQRGEDEDFHNYLRLRTKGKT